MGAELANESANTSAGSPWTGAMNEDADCKSPGLDQLDLLQRRQSSFVIVVREAGR